MRDKAVAAGKRQGGQVKQRRTLVTTLRPADLAFTREAEVH
jgi:hypothetical protein